MKRHLWGALLLGSLMSCNEPVAPQLSMAGREPRLARAATVSDPTSTWKFPLSDAGLSVKSDRKYSDGLYSVYADGVCGVTGKFFASSATSSGDVTVQLGRDNRCKSAPRKLTISYDDGFVETTQAFINLHEIENTTISIPIGATASRFLGIASTTRCDKLQFGKDANSDNVLVTRVDSHTWHVVSQATPNDRAFCTTTGRSYHMQVDFVVVSSRDLP